MHNVGVLYHRRSIEMEDYRGVAGNYCGRNRRDSVHGKIACTDSCRVYRSVETDSKVSEWDIEERHITSPAVH